MFSVKKERERERGEEGREDFEGPSVREFTGESRNVVRRFSIRGTDALVSSFK